MFHSRYSWKSYHRQRTWKVDYPVRDYCPAKSVLRHSKALNKWTLKQVYLSKLYQSIILGTTPIRSSGIYDTQKSSHTSRKWAVSSAFKVNYSALYELLLVRLIKRNNKQQQLLYNMSSGLNKLQIHKCI